MIVHLKTWEFWIHGLLAAFIGGAATGLAAAIVAPESFNLHDGLSKLAELATVSGILQAAAYLKQSPLPAPDEPAQTNPK